MKNKVVITIAVLAVILALVFLPRLIHKKSADAAKAPEAAMSKGIDNFDSKIKEAETFEEKNSLLEAREIYKKFYRCLPD